MTRTILPHWGRREDGNLILHAVVETEAHAMREPAAVIFRIDIVTDRDHVAMIKAGRARPAGLQISCSAAEARAFASQLQLAADVLERRQSPLQG